NATPPTINVPAEITTPATSSNGAAVTYLAEPTSTDDAIRSFDCTPASGSTFPIGKTTVTCTATDGHETTATASFVVTGTEKDEKIAPTFTNWAVTGSLTAGGQTIALAPPEGGKFNGSGEIDITESGLIAGQIHGAVSIPPFTAEIEFPARSGEHQVAGLALTEIGAVNASVTSTSPANCPNPVAGTPATCVNLQVPTAQALTL